MKLVLSAILVLFISDHVFLLTKAREDREHFLNEWAVEIPGGRQKADEVAAQHGYRVERESVTFPDNYLFVRSDVPHRSRRGAHHHTHKLSNDYRVQFAEQQTLKHREKRELQRYDRDLAFRIAQSGNEMNDPEYKHQWYFHSFPGTGNNSVKYDLGVLDAWKKGYTGRGIVSTILDDGLERTHPDLEANYEPLASYDLNEHDPDPSPRYEETNENKHGTRCGGEIAMVANNNLCGVGVAFNSKIGGIRMLDGKVTDRLEGDAIGFGSKHVDISSASWGPRDDGKTLEKAGRMSTKGIMKAINEGRGGKGMILVWASGNGAGFGDHCNADGYSSNIHTLSVSSATQGGEAPWYSERCASTLTSTYSSGAFNEGKVVSADLRHQCTESHTGTSASAPMAAGILALALEANPNMTWRDVQHLVVYTSRMEPLTKEDGWYQNGVGYCCNLAFGFGLINASAMVDMATEWENVGEQHICTVEPADNTKFPIPIKSGTQVDVGIRTDGCKNQTNEINYVEHVQAVLDMDYERRGNIYVELESPSGTITPVFVDRRFDSSRKGFDTFPLTSVHHWGENPDGLWILRVVDKNGNNLKGLIKSVKLILYGTKEQPFYHKYGKKDCHGVGKFAEVKPRLVIERPF